MAEKRKLAFYIRLSDADEEVKAGTKDEKVNSNKLFCTLKISKDLIEYVQKKIKFFLSQS